jgi:hypothetical protein
MVFIIFRRSRPLRLSPAGTSFNHTRGNFIGHEFDIRARYALSSKIETIVGYAHFTPGNFTRNTGKRDNTDFLYLEISVSAF